MRSAAFVVAIVAVGPAAWADPPGETPAVATTSADAVQPPPVSFAMGLLIGTFDTAHPGATNVTTVSESDLGIVGRVRFARNFLVDAELGRSTSSWSGADAVQPGMTTTVRVDKRVGAAIVYDLLPDRGFSPYALAGLGLQRVNLIGNWDATQDYAELGIGVRMAITPNVQVTFDVRAGARRTLRSDPEDRIDSSAMIVAPPAASASDTSEDYTRARIAGVVCF
ncbi:MAG: outer membrane beta-barrel protein [Acidobacteriota bacterium]